MTVAICLVGLPGSGKTYRANCIVAENPNLDIKIADDVSDLDDLPAAGMHDVVIVIDPWFCLTLVRQLANTLLTMKYSSVEWRFFENNPTKCHANVAYRADDRKVTKFIDLYSLTYQPDYVTYAIYQQEVNIHVDIAE